MRINITLLTLLMICGLTVNASASIKLLGVLGKTYAITETDALQEIESKAASIDWQKVIQSNENLEKVKKLQTKGYPEAAKSST